MQCVRVGLVGVIMMMALAGMSAQVVQAQDTLTYGDSVQVTLQPNAKQVWTINGSAGDRIVVQASIFDGREDLQIMLQNAAEEYLGGWTYMTNTFYDSLKTGVQLPDDGQYTIVAENMSTDQAIDFVLMVNRIEDMALPVLQYDQPVNLTAIGGEPQLFLLQPAAGELVQFRLSGPGDENMYDFIPYELYVYGQPDRGRDWSGGCANPWKGFDIDSQESKSIVYRECRIIATGEDLVIGAELVILDADRAESYGVTPVSEPQDLILLVEQVNALPIEAGASVEGELLPGQEIYYAFEAAAGDVITVRLTGRGFVPEIRIESVYGASYGGHDAHSETDKTVAFLENFTLPEGEMYPEGGTYHIVVREEDFFNDQVTGGTFTLEFERGQ